MTKEQTQTNRRSELRDRRVAKGLRADFVASRMGISKSLLSRLEHGSRSWTDDLVREFLVAIGENKQPKRK